MAQAPMQEREILDDVLTSQKTITGTYNAFANECSTPSIRGFIYSANHLHAVDDGLFIPVRCNESE